MQTWTINSPLSAEMSCVISVTTCHVGMFRLHCVTRITQNLLIRGLITPPKSDRAASHIPNRRIAKGFPRAMTTQQQPQAAGDVMQAMTEQRQFRTGENFCVPGLAITNIHFNAPLDHSKPEGEQIEIFARVASHPNHISETKIQFLLYLQGEHTCPPPPHTHTHISNITVSPTSLKLSTILARVC